MISNEFTCLQHLPEVSLLRTSTGRIALSLRDETTHRKFQASRKFREKTKSVYQRVLQWKIIPIYKGNGNLGNFHTHFPLELCLDWSKSRLIYCSTTPRKSHQEFVLILEVGQGKFPRQLGCASSPPKMFTPPKTNVTAKLPQIVVA